MSSYLVSTRYARTLKSQIRQKNEDVVEGLPPPSSSHFGHNAHEAPAATRIDRLELEPFISPLPIPILDARALILPRRARANELRRRACSRSFSHSMLLLHCPSLVPYFQYSNNEATKGQQPKTNNQTLVPSHRRFPTPTYRHRLFRHSRPSSLTASAPSPPPPTLLARRAAARRRKQRRRTRAPARARAARSRTR